MSTKSSEFLWKKPLIPSLFFVSHLHFLSFLFIAGEDDYAIDIFSFGICALEVRETDPQDASLCVCMCVTMVLTDYLCP